MARYKLILAYDGTHFQGFQRQGKTRTVQLELETALRKLGWQGNTLLSAGRTDTGVHASGQVAAADLDWVHGTEALTYALNMNLPDDVAVIRAEEAGADFHPRFDAVERGYRYRIYQAKMRDPLRERFAWRLWPEVSVECLNQCAKQLLGTHDFAAFGNPPKAGGSTLRHVYSAEWSAHEDELSFEVHGNAFLYHMVRRMVNAQVMVGQSRLSLTDFIQSVQNAEPLPPGLAPAQGLVLLEVRYASNRQEAVRLMKTLL
ncbi:MAG: tRNA pseudouridine(38-40) synthase TruA [Anaerolineae bacterium]|nr:tRNA pseudouridine(38-40) synthase TruA [Anaerolineae bacterium]